MPIPMVKCVLCGAEVTKRSTLSLKPFGGGDDRACRDHEEVKQLVEAVQERREMDEQWRQIDWNMRVMSGAALVRVLHTFKGVPLALLYARFQKVGYPQKLINEIKDRVCEEGGPVMSQEEILTTVAMGVELHRRGMEKHSQWCGCFECGGAG